jgi:nicotinate dehydrogenase subunit A
MSRSHDPCVNASGANGRSASISPLLIKKCWERDFPLDMLTQRTRRERVLGKEVVMPKKITLNVNGEDHVVEVEPDSMLLYALRDDLELRGPKFGCGLAQCGACTVLMDGNAIRSCITPVSTASASKIVTLEGLGAGGNPHPLQAAFIAEQAAQCGYCINGMIMTAKAFLDQHPHPSQDDIKHALNDNLCRCGTHMRIVRAIQRAAGSMSP